MADDKKEAAPKTKRPTAQKRDLQSAKRRLHNRSFRSRVSTATRVLEKAPEKSHLSEIFSLIDKGVKTGIYKQNKADRLKSRFSRKVAK